jgi:hypothetical protein
MGLNPCYHGEMPSANSLSSGMATSFFVYDMLYACYLLGFIFEPEDGAVCPG